MAVHRSVLAAFTLVAAVALFLVPSAFAGAKTDLSIAKTADKDVAHPGEQVTYTVTATNNGPEPASGVTVTDPLPQGVSFVSSGPECSETNGTVICELGSIASGDSKSASFVVSVDPGHSPDGTPTDHLLGIDKVEQHVDLEPGETKEFTVSCAQDQALMTDGSIRVDNVAGGNLSDVKVLHQRSGGRANYEFKLRNDGSGRAQAKALGVCVRLATVDGSNHSHYISHTFRFSKSFPAEPGNRLRTNYCEANQRVVSTGYRIISGDARLKRSEPNNDGSRWTWVFDTKTPSQIEISHRCIDRKTDTADGHDHALAFTHVKQGVSLAPGETRDVVVSCGDQSKGIVDTLNLGDLVLLGSTPEVKSRRFRLTNPDPNYEYGVVGLICLGDRVEKGGAGGPITNVAAVFGNENDGNPDNNRGAHTLEIKAGSPPAGSPTPVAPKPLTVGTTGKLRGAAIVPLTCDADESCSGKVKVKAKLGKRLVTVAKKRFRIAGGETAKQKVELTKRGQKAKRKLRNKKRLKVKVRSAGSTYGGKIRLR